jgi:hypothetical protein
LATSGDVVIRKTCVALRTPPLPVLRSVRTG